MTDGADGAIIHVFTTRLLMGQDKTNRLIDSLIIDYLRKNWAGKKISFDDVFLYVGRNFPITTRSGDGGTLLPRFYFLVENRMKALKRKKTVFYDRKLSCWCYNEEAAREVNAETAVPA